MRMLKALSLLALLLTTVRLSEADTWKLPSALTDSNTKVTFEVDSTWHLIHGITKSVVGTIALIDKNDPLSVNVNLKVPVHLFSTDSESRDERLMECMAAETYPEVSFTSTRLSENCKPAIIDREGSCDGVLHGALKMRDVAKNVELPVKINKDEENYIIKGALPVLWADYNIEDPSILIAKLDPTVIISYETRVPLKH